MSLFNGLTMKDYENQMNALRKENFELKLRIYFMTERMQQKCDESTEDILRKTTELKLELESVKRELAEKQKLLALEPKAPESLHCDAFADCLKKWNQIFVDAIQETVDKAFTKKPQVVNKFEPEALDQNKATQRPCSDKETQTDFNLEQPGFRSHLPVPLRLRNNKIIKNKCDDVCGFEHRPAFRSRLPVPVRLRNKVHISSSLFSMCELLQQECQEKEAQINKLKKHLADREVFRASQQ